MPNTYAYESRPLVKPTGFREYDARWLFGTEINLMGVAGAGPRARRRCSANSASPSAIVVGHDFRSYSASIKYALIAGLMAAGVRGARHRPRDHADGLFRPVRARRSRRRDGHRLAQRQRLDRREDGRGAPGHLRPRGDGPAARRSSSAAPFATARAAAIASSPIFPPATSPTSTERPKSARKLKVVAACGNGTAGAFAPELLARARLRGRPARLRSRLHLPALQSESRRPAHAARDGGRR